MRSVAARHGLVDSADSGLVAAVFVVAPAALWLAVVFRVSPVVLVSGPWLAVVFQVSPAPPVSRDWVYLLVYPGVRLLWAQIPKGKTAPSH